MHTIDTLAWQIAGALAAARTGRPGLDAPTPTEHAHARVIAGELFADPVMTQHEDGTVSARWPDGAIACVVAREALDEVIERLNGAPAEVERLRRRLEVLEDGPRCGYAWAGLPIVEGGAVSHFACVLEAEHPGRTHVDETGCSLTLTDVDELERLRARVEELEGDALDALTVSGAVRLAEMARGETDGGRGVLVVPSDTSDAALAAIRDKVGDDVDVRRAHPDAGDVIDYVVRPADRRG